MGAWVPDQGRAMLQATNVPEVPFTLVSQAMGNILHAVNQPPPVTVLMPIHMYA